MKLTCVLLASIAFAITTVNGSVNGADNASTVVGTWRVTSFAVQTLDTKEVFYPVGQNPIGYLQYSPGGHMVVFLSTGTPKRAAGTAYTDAERVDIYNGIFAAYAGTYSVEGNKVTHHVIASWLPEWIGGDQTRYAEIEGNRLTIKTATLKNPASAGREYVATVTFERVE
jgi:hypothetical protein